MNRREALKKTAALGGTAALSGSMLTLLQSCQQQPRLGWEPRFLSTEHAQLVSALVDTILPATDTPGGLDVKADMFIDLMIDKTYDQAGKDNLVAEMNQFTAMCQDQFGQPFHLLDADQRRTILEAEEEKAPLFNGGVWGTAVGEQEPVGFYRSFKSTAIWAYCSSEEIAKNTLNYDPVPGPFQGCIPYTEEDKVWSL